MKKIFLVLSIFAFSTAVNAQKNYEKDANVAFTNREYYKASELYKKAYTKAKKDKKGLILYKTAECYRLMGETKQSEMFYAKAIKGKYTDPIATLRLADAIKIQGRYPDAIVEYNNYKKLAPSDKKGDDGVKSCEMAQKWKDKPTRYEVANMSQINSSESDFGPAYADNKKYTSLLFTSTRKGATGGDMDNTIGQTFSDIFTTKVDKNSKWSEPVTLSEPINSQYNEGASVITKKGNLMFFTRCGVQKKKEEKCQIYMAVKKGNTWGEPELLPFNIDSFAFGHPTISADEQTLIFASDIQGGQGGKDIWMSEYDKKAKKWGNPVNLGADINTSGDEMYPFITEDSTLYISSNGHLGMGGLDIFKAEKLGNRKWGKVTNMKFPLNSPGDDFAIIFEGKKQKGYFTSNREGGKGNDDIWSFNLPALQFSIDGVVTDCKSKEPLQNAIVRLTGSDGSSVDLKTDKAGYYKYADNGKGRYVNENTTYTITVLAGEAKTEKSPKGYLNTTRKDQETTIGVEEAKNFKHDFCLTPIEKEIRFPEVLYDLNKADLRPESKDSLNFLYQTLVDNPTLVIELSAHTDSRASDAYNNKLSDARAKSCVDYLISKGIPKARMVPKGYGETRLLNTDAMIAKEKQKDAQEALHQKNRRTVFTVLRKDYVDPNAPKELPKVEQKPEEKKDVEEEDKE